MDKMLTILNGQNVLITIYISLVTINILIGLFNIFIVKKKKWLSYSIGIVASICLAVFLAYIMFHLTVNDDYPAYESMYNNLTDTGREKGYLLLEKIFHNMGLTYREFRFVIYLACYLIIFIGCLLSKANSNIVLSLYAIIPCFLDGIQTRNFVAMCLLFIGCIALLSRREDSIVYFCIFIVAAFQFHSFAAFFILLILIKIKIKNFPPIFIIMIPFSVYFIIQYYAFGNNILREFFANIYSYINTDNETILKIIQKVYAYAVREYGWAYWSNYMTIFMQFLLVLFSYFAYKGIRYNVDNNYTRNIDYEFYKNLFYFDLLLLCMTPICFIHYEYMRLFRNVSLINYLIFALTLKDSKNNFTAYHFSAIVVLICQVVIHLFFYYQWYGWNRIFYTFFN